jgi:hypothetical protein
VRATITILLSLAVGAGVLASGSRAARPVLPAPIVVTAGSVSFEIARDERITRIHTAGGALPVATREPPVGSLIARQVREWSYGGISSEVVTAPDGGAVAYTATNGDPSHATETVYVLRPGRHRATALYHDTVTPGVCNQGAHVQWHGVWLLYSNVENDIAAVDTADADRTVDLTRLVSRLPGMRNGFIAHWSGEPPAL